MKTKLFNKMMGLAAIVPALAMAQDANLTLDNFNTYYNTYNTGTKMITGIEIEIGADGTNSNNYISSDFETSLYLLPCDNSGQVTGSNPIIIATYTVFGGSLHQMGTYTFSNQSVDLSQVSGLADGTYRMGAWVNSNSFNGIGDPPDYQSDNAGLMLSSGGTSSSSIINFSSASGIKTFDVSKYLTVYPVPAKSDLSVKINLDKEETVTLEMYDLTGKLVQARQEQKLSAGANTLQMNVGTLENGVYFLRMKAADRLMSTKFVINR